MSVPAYVAERGGIGGVGSSDTRNKQLMPVRGAKLQRDRSLSLPRNRQPPLRPGVTSGTNRLRPNCACGWMSFEPGGTDAEAHLLRQHDRPDRRWSFPLVANRPV